MAPALAPSRTTGEPMEGIRISGYRLVRLIGRGGMGEVYEAVQESLSRRVAVKVLPPHLAANESFVQRFNRESGALAKLSHPNIVAIHDCGREGEHYYFVLEFVTGSDGQVAPTLHQRLHAGVPLTVAECAGLIQEIAEALDYAHRKGVIHRDVKPSNVLIEERGHARLVDFGIAHLADGAGGEVSRLTLTGDVLGTAGYLAPEQRQGRSAVDARADVYSCGAMLYEMLTGRIPEGLFELPTELVPTLDVRWNGIIEKALQRNPDRRFQTMDQFLKALQGLRTTTPPPATIVAPPAPAPPPPDGAREPRPKTEAPFTPIVGKCVQCQTVNPGDNRFCTECGGNLYEPCLACQAENRVGTKYCGKCGADMAKLKRVARYRQEVAGHLQRVDQMPGITALSVLDEAQETLAKLLAELTDDAEARKTLAEVRRKTQSLLLAKARSQRGSEAMATYRQALALFPDDREAKTGLDALQRELTALLASASELVSKGEFQTALEQLDRTGADFAQEPTLLSLRGEANKRWRAQFLDRARGQRKGEAMVTYREMLKRFPGDSEAQACLSGLEKELETLAETCFAMIARKDFHAALNRLDEAQRQFGEEPRLLELRAGLTNARWREDLQVKAQGQRECDAMDTYREILKRFPGDREAQAWLSGLEKELETLAATCVALIAAKDFQSALDSIQTGQEQFGEHPRLLELQAQARTRWVGALREELCGLAEERKFVTLRRRLEEVPEWAKPVEGERELREQAAQAGQQADGYGARAKELIAASKFKEAGSEYNKAIGVCADYSGADEVRQALLAISARADRRALLTIATSVVLVCLGLCMLGWAVPFLRERKDRNDWARTQMSVRAAGGDEVRIEQLYLDYKVAHPAGCGASAASQAVEELRDKKDWAQTDQAVKAVGQDAARIEELYGQYLTAHPNGRGAKTAAPVHLQLKEERLDRTAWNQVKEGLSKSPGDEARAEQLYRKYLGDHPNGRNATNAAQALAPLAQKQRERNMWAQTQEGVRTAGGDETQVQKLYRQYLSDYANGPNATAANQALAESEDRARSDRKDWEEVQRLLEGAGSDEARAEQLYKEYLGKHPKGQGVSAANRYLAQHWKNSLGMKFVPVAGTEVLFCIWETRVRDFEAFVKATGHDATSRMYSVGVGRENGDTWKSPGFSQGPTHPVCGVSWEDAKAFCAWLTRKERSEGNISASQSYRLPTDWEWSMAVGLNESRSGTPQDKSGKTPDVYPWGGGYPPPADAGNYAGSEARTADWQSSFQTIEGYRDDFPRTSPAGSFKANRYGIYDLGGNVWEWCEDWRDTDRKYRVLRGAAWDFSGPDILLSSCRFSSSPGDRDNSIGFRCVLVVGGSAR